MCTTLRSMFIYKRKKQVIKLLAFLEAPPRFELGIKALQASALPLGYGAKLVARAGIEPATRGFSVLCSTD